MKTYDKYKSSGIDWIGDIPEHWEVKRLKWICAFEYGNSLSSDIRLEGEIPVFGSNGITGYHSHSITESPCIVVGRKGSFGKLNWSNEKCFPIDTTYFIDETKTKEDLRWLFYLLQNLELDSFSKDTGVPGLSREDAYSKIAPFPSSDEQTAIADYLDEKTAQTDKLIAEKRRLIELLKEERLGVINQAVTRGINPHAKLKPSGIAWLGDIPEHWEVKRLKFITKIKYGLGQPPNQKDDGLPLIRATNVERGRIVEKDLLFVDPEDIPYDRDPILKENDIIVVRSGAYTADSAIIPKQFDGAIAGYDMVLRAYKDLPFFIAFCLLSNYVLINQLYLERLRAAQPHLNKEELGETLIMLPPIEEQKQIIEFIETATGKIDATIATIEKEIGFLREYRTALISEVVTGKIKIL